MILNFRGIRGNDLCDSVVVHRRAGTRPGACAQRAAAEIAFAEGHLFFLFLFDSKNGSILFYLL